MDYVEKYWRIIEHPKLNRVGPQPIIDIEPHKVNPLTNAIDPDTKLNTQFQFWVEFMYNDGSDPFIPDHKRGHDWNFDCGGNTYEEAISTLYDLVIKKFGDY